MEKVLLLILIMAAILLPAGCKAGSRSEEETESSAAVQTEETLFTEAVTGTETASAEETSSQPESRPETAEADGNQESPEEETEEPSKEESSEMTMNVEVGGSTFTATMEQNASAAALSELMEQGPVTIQMRDYSGFEKVGSLGQSLPASNSQMTARAGDIVLYQGNQIVMFYGSNSWSYTRLARVSDLTGWEDALGSGDVTVTFSLAD